MSFVSVRGLTAGYGKSVVLRGIDLDVDEGESLAVVGKNGAGKSTLLNSFFGGTTIRGGTIEVGGKAPDAPGYDLTGLYVGSEGTLGMATKVICRLVPMAEAVKTLLVVFPTIAAASTAA